MDENKIRVTMKSILDNHRDNMTGELNHTSLAEETCLILNLYEDDIDYVIPERLFEIAIEFD